MKLVLGSQSPRRKKLLDLAGYTFSIRSANIDESLSEGWGPEEAVIHLSQQKSETLDIECDEVLLTSDTVVAKDGRILGKPANAQEAYQYLRSLSGKTHQVYTGVTIRSHEDTRCFSVVTDVTFFDLVDEEIQQYIATGESDDKAGGYGIQGKGALFVEKINGDYYNVVGLPLSKVVRELRAFGCTPSS
ncbi:Maf family protein [Halobacillus mangrovi]|uniref:Maf family protein n=1 Tax=Halobacillus mangrovi TaxID=402384 RepID=UPI003D95A3A7